LAALYDLFCEGRKDFDFYLKLVMSAHAVLDVGCGTGALLHLARMRGHTGRLCGLDPAVGMLEQARKRADIDWILGDLASRPWKAEFDLVVMTGHAFQVLLTDDDIRAAFRAVHSALSADGRFAFETRNPKIREWECWTSASPVEVIKSDGTIVRMSRAVSEPVQDDLVSFTHTFTSPAWRGGRLSQSTLRFLDLDMLSQLLSDCGLAVDQQFGDWSSRPLTATSPEIITIARIADDTIGVRA
jgi:ubiquinone/menaquinone biosynthesis C-methylase UbiE